MGLNTMPKKTILILTNATKPSVPELVRNLQPWFDQQGYATIIATAVGPIPPEAMDAQLCLVIGGDGTILSAARTLIGRNMPLMGLNRGKLGFLAEFDVKHMQKHLDDILRGKVKPTRRIMLEITVKGKSRDTFQSPAVNEVAISSGKPFRTIDIFAAQGDHHIARYTGDGLIVSTPTGATGHNLSAGGPILEPTLDAIVITPLAPHTLSLSPIVLRSSDLITLEARRVNPGTTLIVDGQITTPLCKGDIVEIRKSSHEVLIVPHPGKSFFHTLSTKLHWGASPLDT